MKNRTLLGLPLALVIAMTISAAAQTETQTQTTTSQPQEQQNLAAPNVEPKEPLKVESKEGFWGKLNPFARKKYVRRQLEPVAGRVNELDELTASNARAINDVDARASEGIRVASLKANEADQRAIEANTKASLAHQTATQATEQLTKVEGTLQSLDQYQTITEAEIRFRPGQVSLSKKAKEALDEMAAPLKTQRGFVLEVQGFSSSRGVAGIENSKRLADAVVRYLVVEHEIPVYRIYTVGMGNAVKPAADGEKPRRTSGGRVEISLLRNSLADLQAQQQPTPQQQQQQLPASDRPQQQ